MEHVWAFQTRCEATRPLSRTLAVIYLAIAIRIVYGQRWIVSGLKAVLGLILFWLMLGA